MPPGDRCGPPPPRRGPIINVQIAPRWRRPQLVVQVPPPRPAPVVVVQTRPRPQPTIVVQQAPPPPPPYYPPPPPPSDGHFHNPLPPPRY